MKIEIIKSGWLHQKWRFRIKARNGQVLATSESYHNFSDMIKTIHSIQYSIRRAEIVNIHKVKLTDDKTHDIRQEGTGVEKEKNQDKDQRS